MTNFEEPHEILVPRVGEDEEVNSRDIEEKGREESQYLSGREPLLFM